MAKGGNMNLYAVGIPALIVFSLYFFPSFWIYVFLTIDFLTPWKIFDSEIMKSYHGFLMSNLPERPAQPLLELFANNYTVEDVMRLSEGFTKPVVIRGLIANSTGVKHWHDKDWWESNYGNEQILCGTFEFVRPTCTISDFMGELRQGKAFYVTGASKIFARHPDLAAMVDVEALKALEPGPRISTQLFMGLDGMGSDIHAAIGVNLFRQMAGQKRWWFVPPSQTAYLLPSINVNGFSAHTRTKVGTRGGQPSPWFSKIERYTSIINTGDLLINPPWYWHGILNMAQNKTGDLVIGVPTRYGGKQGFTAAFKSNWYLTTVAILTILKQYGSMEAFLNRDDVLEDQIAKNRQARQALYHTEP